jgi:hypothetical protein
MFDAEDVQWLLAVVAVMALIALGLATWSTHLENRYARGMVDPDAESEGGSQARSPHAVYHAQALAQSAVSYGVSMFFAGLGFVLLVDADNDGRGLAAAIIALLLAVVFFVESRKSRTGLLEQTRALRAEDEDLRRAEERYRLVTLVTEGPERDKLVADLLLQGEPLGRELTVVDSRAGTNGSG